MPQYLRHPDPKITLWLARQGWFYEPTAQQWFNATTRQRALNLQSILFGLLLKAGVAREDDCEGWEPTTGDPND